jgi:hypothetical protein
MVPVFLAQMEKYDGQTNGLQKRIDKIIKNASMQTEN